MRIVVKAVKQRAKNYSICDMNDIWYSDFGSCPFSKGDILDIEFEENGLYKNIRSANVVSSPVSHQEAGVNLSSFQTSNSFTPDKDRLIVRQSCLKAAVEAYVQEVQLVQTLVGDNAKMPSGNTIRRIMEIAEEFENWVFR